MEKTYNIRDIYVGTISRNNKLQDSDFSNEDKKVGLFVKTLLGYKHILTGDIYNITSSKTSCKTVLKSTEICRLTQYDNGIVRRVLKNIIYNKMSCKISLYHVDYLEYILNNELRKSEEKELKV